MKPRKPLYSNYSTTNNLEQNDQRFFALVDELLARRWDFETLEALDDDVRRASVRFDHQSRGAQLLHLGN